MKMKKILTKKVFNKWYYNSCEFWDNHNIPKMSI